MILNSKKIVFNVILALTFACVSTSHAMETFKQSVFHVANQAISNEPLKIATATFAGLCASDIIDAYRDKIVFKKPFGTSYLAILKDRALGSLIYSAFMAAACRAGSKSPLILSDLAKPITKVALATATCAALSGTLAYIAYDKYKTEIDDVLAGIFHMPQDYINKLNFSLFTAFGIGSACRHSCLMSLPIRLYLSRNKTC